ncbi:MAG TPA: tetratricopeptide repeat protein [Terracidiphilus sp.]|nr:tetratricopeptide repeat protein [Terracidiphilus sp.]
MALTMTVYARGLAAQESSPDRSGLDRMSEERGRILLVLPFDNRTGQPSLEWIREASAEILSRRLASAGFASMSRADRLYALDHVGLPQGFHPSRATALKLAETLDADSIVVGSYLTDGTGIVAEARLVDVPRLRMSEAVSARGEMRDLISVFDSLAWKLTRQLDPGFKGSEETFVAAGAGLSLVAFEQYIRGITEPDQAERLRRLNQAVAMSPDFGPAWMALGQEDYNGQQYEQAAAAFGKVVRGDPKALGPDALEAGFYRGLSLVFSGDYAKAEEAFAGVARVLPLAEVVNNEGVAVSRQGHDGSALFRQAVETDPNAADYHFNLAVSLKRRGGYDAEALTELAQCLRLRPSDSEALAVQKAWTESAQPRPAKPEPAKGPVPPQVTKADVPDDTHDLEGDAGAKPDPLERIARNFDAVAFHQAALMLDQVDESRLAALTPLKRAETLAGLAKDYLDRGLLLEAERLYQSALAADPKLAEAHAGLAEVRERTGDAEAARMEARTSLELMPSVEAYLVMGRLDLAAGHIDQARYDAGEALKLAPTNRAAQELWRQIETREGQKK